MAHTVDVDDVTAVPCRNADGVHWHILYRGDATTIFGLRQVTGRPECHITRDWAVRSLTRQQTVTVMLRAIGVRS